jgi:hypothetical protein
MVGLNLIMVKIAKDGNVEIVKNNGVCMMEKVIRKHEYEEIVLESNLGYGVNITSTKGKEIALNDRETKLLMDGLKEHFDEKEWDF